MSHITGHVEDSAASCGILKPDLHDENEKDDCHLYFIPPSNWTPKPPAKVKFDLIEIPDGNGGFIPVAYNLIQIKGEFTRSPADAAETEKIRKYGAGIKKEESENILAALRRLKTKAEKPVFSNGH